MILRDAPVLLHDSGAVTGGEVYEEKSKNDIGSLCLLITVDMLRCD
jgi:hypothetical protein